MDDVDNRERLYRQTLDTASRELRDLSDEIERLQALLAQAQRRQASVAQLCEALSAWLDLSAKDADAPDLPDPLADGPVPSGLCLTEEEVALIAYPDPRPRGA